MPVLITGAHSSTTSRGLSTVMTTMATRCTLLHASG